MGGGRYERRTGRERSPHFHGAILQRAVVGIPEGRIEAESGGYRLRIRALLLRNAAVPRVTRDRLGSDGERLDQRFSPRNPATGTGGVAEGTRPEEPRCRPDDLDSRRCVPRRKSPAVAPPHARKPRRGATQTASRIADETRPRHRPHGCLYRPPRAERICRCGGIGNVDRRPRHRPVRHRPEEAIARHRPSREHYEKCTRRLAGNDAERHRAPVLRGVRGGSHSHQ